METTYTYSAWFFTRALSAVYLVAFLSLLPQAQGLWGKQGVLPIAPYMKAIEKSFETSRIWRAPSVFWLSTSDEFITGAAITGAVAAGLALIGFAQGWSLLMCFILYLSFCTAGQDFMAFQWDSLLCEVGFLALFAVPWNFDFSLSVAVEPHWLVRYMFYGVLFKLMFLSGIVKLLSGDESWRDFTAMSYHYLTQPLPNPISPFVHSLPEWVHWIGTGFTFLVELILPFFIFWPRSRCYAAFGFILLLFMILMTGNFAFFNGLTIAICFWLIPDRIWERLVEYLPFEVKAVPAAMFPHPVLMVVIGFLGVMTFIWCVRFMLPDFLLEVIQPVIAPVQTFRISNSYGLFATMTKTRPEIILEGSNDRKEWKEYVFKYKPGPLDRRPPWVAPFQPRLDWQMWFAALGPIQESPWVATLITRIFAGAPEILNFFVSNPFPDVPPKFLRAKLYNYEFASVDEILNNDLWWKRTLIGDYTPELTRP